MTSTINTDTELKARHRALWGRTGDYPFIAIDMIAELGPRLVDAVGGVDVCAPVRLRDRKAGLRLPKGTSHVDGETGLAYVRARSVDARADLGRVERQQRFLAAMAHRAMSSEVLLDPRALVRFLEAAMSAVRADPGLTEEQLIELGTRLRHVGGGDIQFQTVPVANPSYRAPDGQAVALWDDAAATELFASLKDAHPRPRPFHSTSLSPAS